MSQPVGTSSVFSSTSVESLGNDCATINSETVESGSASLPPKKQKTLTSEVWKHYIRKNVGSTIMATCNFCKKKFDAPSSKGTTHLKNHFNNCLFNPNRRQLKKDSKQRTLGTTTIGGETKLVTHKFDDMVERSLFGKMIAKHDYPFMMSEHSYFCQWISYIMPTYKFRSRITVKNDLMGVFAEERTMVYKKLEQLSSRVSLTTDGWKPKPQNRGYFCLTCHYINDDWVLHSRIIAFRVVEYPHHGLNMSEWLKNRILEWNLDKKLFSVVVDNASNNTGMLDGIRTWLNGKDSLIHNGDMFHLRCAPHIINLIVKKGLEVIHGLVEGIRKTVKYIDGSPARGEKFALALAQTKFNSKRQISIDVETRWNSTYDMLVNALELRDAIVRLSELDSDYKLLPSDEEWERGKIICGCLKLFYDVTKTLSGVKYPTANLYYHVVHNIRMQLLNWRASRVDYIRSMGNEMQEKFDKYWEEASMALTIAVILDPRFKMLVVELTCKQIYGEFADLNINRVCDYFHEVYSEYVEVFPIVAQGDSYSNHVPEVQMTNQSMINLTTVHGFKEYMASSGITVGGSCETDLQLYLKESLHPDSPSFDILNWWKLNGPKYPILAKMARDILAISTSSVPSESAFSKARRVIVDNRSSLNSETVEALMCVKDWMPERTMDGENISGERLDYVEEYDNVEA